MYYLELTKKAEKQLDKLDQQIKERISANLERIRIRPKDFLKKLVGNPYYRLKVGDYRVILNIIENKLLILVIQIGHKKNIYKK
jgi:mRNA interferase RelE/StbE